jgi:hypothetical protein
LRKVVEPPRNRNLDEVDFIPELESAIPMKHISHTASIELVVLGHHARVIDKSIFHEEPRRVRGQVPRRRPITHGLQVEGPVESFEAALEDCTFFSFFEAYWTLVKVAMMAEFVPKIADATTEIRVGVHRMARRVERRRYTFAL